MELEDSFLCSGNLTAVPCIADHKSVPYTHAVGLWGTFFCQIFRYGKWNWKIHTFTPPILYQLLCWKSSQYKKGKVTPLQAPLWPKGGRGIALLFKDLGARRGWGVSSRPWLRFTPRVRPGINCTGGYWVNIFFLNETIKMVLFLENCTHKN
jgi:hypothetical protein